VPTRRVVILAPDDLQPLDAIGPLEVLHTATLLRENAYTVEIVTPGGGVITSRSGLRLLADPLPAVRDDPLDVVRPACPLVPRGDRRTRPDLRP
jgi:transcriptional regulator GlxA family with amidase domain